MRNQRPHVTRIVFPVLTIMCFFLILIWASYIRQRYYDKEDSVRFGVQRNANLAVAFEQFTIRTIRSADAILKTIRMELQDGDITNVKDLQERSASGEDLIEGIFIINRQGRVEKTSMDAINPAAFNLADKDFFAYHAAHDVDTLLINTPGQSIFSGKPAITISRRLVDRHQQFAGVVALMIQPSSFTSFYAKSKLLPNDILSLIAPNGITYARRTGSRESSGESISKSPLFVHVKNHPDSFYFAPDAIRGIPSWFCYRKLEDYPIIATVGSAEADILADFNIRQQRYLVPRIIISILVIIIALIWARFKLHRRKVLNQLVQEEERYQRLLTEQMIAVQEREREWIGRELHDNVNQVLTTVKLYLESVSREDSNPLIPRSVQLINSSINDIRNLSHQLSAPTLGTRSLIDSIHVLVENAEVSSGIQFKFKHEGYVARVAMNQKLALYRILQEQINNILKHAQATNVQISLTSTKQNVVLDVKDNGKGFDFSASRCGMGINNIISRARALGGDVHINTAPAKGCFLRVEVPALA